MGQPSQITLLAPTADSTRSVGEAIGALLLPGDAMSLAGDLGAGKTTLVQGLARALGYEGHVASPTFTLVREYRGRLTLQHVDVYRLEKVQDVLDLGLDDAPEAVLAVEWGDAVEGLLPPDHLSVELTVLVGPDGTGEERRISLRAPAGSSWTDRWSELEAATAGLADKS